MKKEKRAAAKLDVQVNLKKAESYHFVPQLSNVFFPFPPYPQQVTVVRAIQQAVRSRQNALIESPTGTGKTVCLLVGSLSALMEAEGRKKVYYLTRTHSQISQVVSEFRRTVYDCNLNVIASRDQACLNHNLAQLRGKQLEKACEELCSQRLCTFREFSFSRIPRPMELQEFRDFCKKELVCPYFYAKQLTDRCEITVLPFNYLLDWNLFEKNSIDLRDAVVIFDEAHNIDSLCEQGSDVRLTADTLALALSELRQLIKLQSKKYLHRQFKEPHDECRDVETVREVFELLLGGIRSAADTQFVSRENFVESIEQMTSTSSTEGLDLGNYSGFVVRARKVIKVFHKKEQGCDSTQMVVDVLEKIYATAANLEEFRKFTVNLVKGELLLRCLDPSLCFRRLLDCRPRAILLSSGTLGNLDIWERNLQVSFPHKITTESFITAHHLYAQLRPKSENGIPFNFSFQGKQSQRQFEEICKDLRKMEDLVNGGVIVAFSNYDLLEKTLKFASIINRKVFFETKGGNVDQIFKQYSAEVESGTAFLFIIMKGRFSEGINFAGKLCRCLVVVGIPFLPLKDPGVVEKMKYLESNCARGDADAWYTEQSFRSLNQTIGRAIRNLDDYAAILLLDQRFLKEENLKHLSSWFTNCLRPSGNTYQEISQFLKTASIHKNSCPRDASSSTKNNKTKNEVSICERLLEFSTPSKTLRKKMKLKFDSSEKAAEPQLSPLKEIKVQESEEQAYHYMNESLANFFMDSFTKPTSTTQEEDQPSLHGKDEGSLKDFESLVDF